MCFSTRNNILVYKIKKEKQNAQLISFLISMILRTDSFSIRPFIIHFYEIKSIRFCQINDFSNRSEAFTLYVCFNHYYFQFFYVFLKNCLTIKFSLQIKLKLTNKLQHLEIQQKNI